MPSIYYLNPPPFWDFVANFGAPPQSFQQPQEQPEPPRETPDAEKAPADDPPEVDPSTLRDGTEIPFRQRGRRGHPGTDNDSPRGSHSCRGRGGFSRGGFGPREHRGPPGPPFGPPPFAFGHGPPWWARREGHGPHHRGGPCRRGGPQHRGPSPPHPPPFFGQGGPFNLEEFVENMKNNFSNIADHWGLDRFTTPRNPDVDFEPRADIFDRPAEYLIHLSLPGAKKEDVGVDWDGENSTLKIAGVVYRPGADEELLSQLAVDGRKRETGVFEKSIRLGTRRDPAGIDVSGITAKMTDGVLVVRVPKVEVQHKRREVPIGSATPSPARNENDLLFDADDAMTDVVPESEGTISAAPSEKGKAKEAEHQKEKEANTTEHTNLRGGDDQLPAYTQEDARSEEDWENYGSDEEPEYVKINVD